MQHSGIKHRWKIFALNDDLKRIKTLTLCQYNSLTVRTPKLRIAAPQHILFEHRNSWWLLVTKTKSRLYLSVNFHLGLRGEGHSCDARVRVVFFSCGRHWSRLLQRHLYIYADDWPWPLSQRTRTYCALHFFICFLQWHIYSSYTHTHTVLLSFFKFRHDSPSEVLPWKEKLTGAHDCRLQRVKV